MKVKVDFELCANLGQCALAAPEVFSMGAGGLTYDEAPAESSRDAVEEAVDVCPMQAIGLDD
ncbi:ferredoxin [Actinomadura nitritigenes]|uniref:ferredoxin n=1 Tax=Actinomadura nitritigenes TaxID=134602 RepID=UPI003D8B7933